MGMIGIQRFFSFGHSATIAWMVRRIRRCLPVALLWSVWLGAGGCGDTVTYIECPPGTVPVGSQCIAAQDTQLETVEPDASQPDTTPVDGPETSAPDTEAPLDTTPAEVEAPRATGASCTRNADCAGGTCLDWTGGYCTRLDCGGAGCGAGEVCLGFAGNELCVASCQSDADCRTPDQACKTVVGGEGVVKVCIGVDVDAGGTGAGCGDATDCAGRATCLAAFPGGYCAALGCDVDACPAGAACVKVDGRPSCLLRCASDPDCGGQVGAERRCGVLQGTAGSPVDVCISGVAGKALGESCRSDFECTSGTCQILGEGRCSQTGWTCFLESVARDCNGAEFCQVTPESRVGVCSQPCALGGRTCPGASHCLAEGDTPREAWCRPACTGPTDGACNAAAGLTCAFGVPVSDSGQGRYACTRTGGGSVFTGCNGDAACGGGSCLLDGNSGYCTAACGEDSHCAFGGSCVFGASERCQRACLSSLDCPSGFACQLTSGSTREVCVP